MVVERRGEEAFALVPMRLYRFLEEERRKLIESTEAARRSFADLSEEEAEGLIAQELASHREQQASSRRSAAG